MKQNNKFYRNIIAIILSLIMLFSNITNTLAYEWDLQIPSIGGEDIIINGNDDLIIDDTVIIDTSPNTNNNNNNNNNTSNSNNQNVNVEIENNNPKEIIESDNIQEDIKTLSEKFDEKTGLTVTVPIVPNYNFKRTKNNEELFNLVGGDKGADAIVAFKGDEAGAGQHSFIDYITRENNDPTSVGYCISPFYKGAKENTTTTVKEVKDLTENDKILLGIAVAGYPHNKFNVAGFDELTEEERYYATLVAIEHYLFQYPNLYKNAENVKFNGEHWNSTRWYPNPSVSSEKQKKAQKIIKLAEQIYTKGKSNPYDPEKGIATITIADNNKNNGELKLSDNEYILTIDLTSDTNYSHTLLQFEDPKIKEWATGDTKIQFYDGEGKTGTRLNWTTKEIDGKNYEGIIIEKTSRKSDKVTIVLDKETAKNVIQGESGNYSVPYTVKFFGGNMQVGYKTANTNSSLQDYVIITTGNATAKNKISWIKTDMPNTETSTESTTGTTTTTSTPPPEDKGKGGLKILKYNKKTNELVAGAIFKIRGISEGVYDFNVQIQASNGAEIPLPNGGKAVCKDGVIEISNINVGTYEITEITPPPNFDIAEGQNSQTVQVESEKNATLYPQVRFENNPYGILKIKKIDAITGEPLEGAVLKISNPLFDYEQEFTTGADGTIEIENLKQGSYEIKEVKAPNGYILSNETKVAVLKWGETTEITYENQPKTSLVITKIDSATGEKLDGARFKLKHTTSGAEYFTDETVDGVATIEELIEGTYTLTEIQAPNGYILNKDPITVVVENDRVNEVTIKNSKKPSITVNKVDSETKEPLSGAKFELWRAENNTVQGLIEKVGEYYTNEDGKINLKNLDYGWYAVKEILAPQGYLLAKDNIRFVYLEPNQTEENEVSITFENDKKPSLKVIKRDIDTKEVLSGTKFEIWRAENNTTQGLLEKVGEYFTNEQGEIVLDVTEYGWYCIKELEPPKGYLLSEDNVKFVFLEPNQTGEKQVQVIFENAKKPSLTINKVGSVGKEPLKGAKFSLFYAGDNKDGAVEKIGDYITDERGKIEIPTGTLKAGWYKLQETQAPEGYEIQGTGTYEFFLKAGESKEITIENVAKNAIIIKKVDADTGEPLAGATFSVSIISDGGSSGTDGTTIANVITNSNGVAVVTGLKAGGYVIQETKAPEGYIMLEKSETIWLNKDDTSAVTVTFENRKNAGLGIKKLDSITKEPLANAVFKVTDSKGQVVGTSNGLFRTDEKGFIHIPNLDVGAYVVQEIQAPNGYILDDTPQTIHITYGKIHTLEFFNMPKTSILIKKYDSVTKEPLQGAVFKVTNGKGQVVGNGNGLFTTNINGTILVPDLKAGTYIVEEIKAPEGYILESKSQVVEVENGKVYTLDFYNKPTNSLIIQKYDAETKEPLADAKIKVEKLGNSVQLIGEYRTDKTGRIVIPDLKAGSYSVQEVEAPKGYILDNTAKTVVVKQGETQVVELFNKKYDSLTIVKLDKTTKEPLENATIKVTTSDDKLIGEYRTDATGTIVVPNLKAGAYKVQEVKAPEGYILDNTVKLVHLKEGEPQIVELFNKKYDSLTIVKLDATTKEPLEDATIKVTTAEDTLIGEYRTDETGTIVVPNLKAGIYKVQEVKAPKGYILDNTVKLVHLKEDKPQIVELFNKKYDSLTIVKLDTVTKQPLADATIKVTTVDDKFVGEYTTDITGTIVVPNLKAGTYKVQEIKAPQGYILDNTVKLVHLKQGEPQKIEIYNSKKTGIQILKRDSKTSKPLQGAKFEVRKVNGELIGANYISDENGLITINGLEQGWYTVKETTAPKGYALNNNVQNVEVKSDKYTQVVFENDKLGSIRLKKIDFVTKKPIAGVKFKFTKESGENVGEFVTDKWGEINLVDMLEPTTYLIEEVAVPQGYALDKGVRKVKIEVGTEIMVEWENYPLATLEINKIDERTKKPIAGVEFEILNAKKQSMGKFTTDKDGRIYLEKKLGQGTYYVKETKAPAYYVLNEQEFEVSIKENKEVIKLEVENKSVDLKTGGEKSTVKETKAGDIIRYDFNNLQNLSSVALDEFYIHESLPSAITVQRIFTGTFNQNMKYKITYKTNKNNQFKILQDNLFTDRVYEIDLTKGLQKDEYITDLRYEFDSVGVGFREVEKPFLYAKVNSNVKKNEQFTNILTVGGKYDMQTVKHEDKFTTTVISTTPTFDGKLPKTGY